jgi:DNA-binding FadR family transcriptional regulator
MMQPVASAADAAKGWTFVSETEWARFPRLRVHEHVLMQIEERMIDGRLQAGDRLPGERQLAEMLGVSRASVREALRVLEAMGILAAQTGSGPEAGSVVASNAANAMTTLLRMHIALANFSMRDVVDTRVLLEGWAAAHVAKRANSAELAKLRKLVGEMRREDLDPPSFNALDTDFHVAIAQASGNRLVAHFMEAIRHAVHQRMVTAFDGIADWRSEAVRLTDEHEQLVALLEAGDALAARDQVEQHIRGFYEAR